MEEAITKRRGAEGTNATKLILDNCNIKEISKTDASTLTQYRNLTQLALNRTMLSDISNFPPLRTLKTLELTDNYLRNDLDKISACENLERLYLSGNRFQSVADLKPLAALKHLKTIELELNPLTKEDAYQSAVFQLIPSLTMVDMMDRCGNLHDSEDEEEEVEIVGEGQLIEEDTVDDYDEDEEKSRRLIQSFYTKEISDNESDGGEFSEPPEEDDEEEISDDEDEEDQDKPEEEGKRPCPNGEEGTTKRQEQ
eukprot:GHVN01051991.1.p3 GENE.GHVN01051991.1~~GHVN01051991.1.p3  ORF type:complete len:254 (+),score=46.33 GHVN01051991.1:3869-4630(+)